MTFKQIPQLERLVSVPVRHNMFVEGMNCASTDRKDVSLACITVCWPGNMPSPRRRVLVQPNALFGARQQRIGDVPLHNHISKSNGRVAKSFFTSRNDSSLSLQPTWSEVLHWLNGLGTTRLVYVSCVEMTRDTTERQRSLLETPNS